MLKKLWGFFLLGVLGCSHTKTINAPLYRPLLQSEPLSDEDLHKIKKDSPKDAVFADLLQAFALMRSADLSKKNTRKDIINLLSSSVDSFEDMKDPVNFSQAFSADESKPFRGRPHERMFAATMAGVFLMADNNCSQALPYLRNAEFLDARFQKMPFGTDAPLIYALMYRCLVQKDANSAEAKRAADGVFKSVRFLTMQETFLKALVAMSEADLRPMALVNRLAYMLYEISIYHSLITASDEASAEQLLEDAAKNASIFISALKTNFDAEYQERMKPLIDELAKVYGLNNAAGRKHVEELSLSQISLEVKVLSAQLKNILDKSDWFKKEVAAHSQETRELTAQILKAARAQKMVLSFSGLGPSLVREGSYDEISVVKPGEHANKTPYIRERNLNLSTSCGFHRTSDGGFSVTLCSSEDEGGSICAMPSLELLSLSRKASTAQGRKFEKVLKGRAQFKAATEDIADISVWSAFFLFTMGADIINDCHRRDQPESCAAPAYAIWAVAAVTLVFSGSIWLLGKTVNPAADSRFIHLMYESSWLSL